MSVKWKDGSRGSLINVDLINVYREFVISNVERPAKQA